MGAHNAGKAAHLVVGVLHTSTAQHLTDIFTILYNHIRLAHGQGVVSVWQLPLYAAELHHMERQLRKMLVTYGMV